MCSVHFTLSSHKSVVQRLCVGTSFSSLSNHVIHFHMRKVFLWEKEKREVVQRCRLLSQPHMSVLGSLNQ